MYAGQTGIRFAHWWWLAFNPQLELWKTTMSTNLDNADAIEKLKKLAKGIDFAMLATALKAVPIHMIPMSTKKVDDQGRIWFLSGRDSTHNKNIQQNSDVHLVYANTGSMQFLNVYGAAEISNDKQILKELYGKTDDAWFKGVDDPNLTAICVTPKNAYHWDPKSNKLVTLFKMGYAAVTGQPPQELMDQGELKI